jgi:glucose/arabinose dehydrogenase/type 1 glutamine amidotransferase
MRRFSPWLAALVAVLVSTPLAATAVAAPQPSEAVTPVTGPGRVADVTASETEDPALDWGSYEKVTLSTDTGAAMDLAVLPDGRVLHTAREGAVRLTDPETGVTRVVNQLDVYTGGEQGLTTVTLAPDFETSKWVYLYYAPRLDTPSGRAPDQLPAGETEAYWEKWKGYDVLSRFKWDEATDSLDLSTEQQIIRIDTNRGGGSHHAGDVAFDDADNLYLSTGDNTAPDACGAAGYAPTNDTPGWSPACDNRRGAGNTNDLRGKILRIHVNDDGSYTVPDGNLFPESQGTQDKTRPEIFVMGLRNPFRIHVDPVTDTLLWGDYAPDAGRDDPRRGPMGLVEWNVVPIEGGAHNSGWPYCIADNRPYNDWDYVNSVPREWFDCSAPRNTSRHNTGLVELPPVVPADVWYGDRNCATLAPEDCDNPQWPELTAFSENIEQAPMGGPVYRFDAANPSATKLPAYWDGKAFLGEFSQDYVAALSFTAPDGPVTKIENFLPNADLGAHGYDLWDMVMDLEFGPDGSLYVIQHSGSLVRVDYTPGNKRPLARISADPTSGAEAPLPVRFDASGSTDPENQALTYEWDFDGDGAFDASGVAATHTYDAIGQYNARLRVTDTEGRSAAVSTPITVGNAAPTVTLTSPENGGFFDGGKAVIYDVEISDPEGTGDAACNRVHYQLSIGHASHAHPRRDGRGCRIGVPMPPDAGHGATENIFGVLEVSYTDAGANGVPAATGSTRVLLNPKVLEAEHADDSSGVTISDDPTASATRTVTSFDPADWIAYEPVSFAGITSVQTRASGAGTLALRWNSPTAQPFATVDIPAGEGWQTVDTALPEAPADSGTLYLTSDGGVTVDSFTMQGDGVSDVQPPTVSAVWNPAEPTGENGWYTTAPTLSLSPVDNGSIYNREYSLDDGDTWQQILYADVFDNGDDSWTNNVKIETPGEHKVRYRVFDTSFNVSNVGSLPVKIDRTAPEVTLQGVAGGEIGDSRSLRPRASDPAPGSGGASVTGVTLDGDPVAGKTIAMSGLDLGEHSIAVETRDTAGNTGTTTETFSVTTSFDDVRSLVDQFKEARRIPAQTAAILRDRISRAQDAAQAGSTAEANRNLDEFLSEARNLADTDARAILVRDAEVLRGQTDGTAPAMFATLNPEQPTGNNDRHLEPVTLTVDATDDADTWQEADDDGTPPTVSATLDPEQPTGNNSWYLEPVTLTVDATDTSAIASREYSLDGGQTWQETDAEGKATISQEGRTEVRYRATDTAGNSSPEGTVMVRIDTRPTVASFPVIEDGRIGDSQTLVPKLTEPLPGSADGAPAFPSDVGLNNPAVLRMMLDGSPVPVEALNLTELPLGRHRLAITANDVAGNAATYTVTFVLVASFDDLDTLIGRYVDAGSVSTDTAARLRDYLSLAERAAGEDREAAAIDYLNEFIRVARSEVGERQTRTTLVRDAEALIDQVEHGPPPTDGTGVTATPAPTPAALPTVTPAPMAPNPDAEYKILLTTGRRTTGFRHNSIPDAIVAIQKLGAKHGFDVDLFDPAYPDVSLPTSPFTSAKDLAQYKAVVFLNSGSVYLDETERAALQGYIRNGGGFAGIHDAGSTLTDWDWFGELVGARFASHPQGPFSTNPPCEPCFPGVAVTEDSSHPSTRHLPTRWSLVDEFHNYQQNPRAQVHTLMTLDEESYKHNLNLLKEGPWERGYNDLMGDHPISWCHNFQGGRAWFQGLGHNRELFHDPTYRQILLKGIQTAAGAVPANCTSYQEVADLITQLHAQGKVSDDAAVELHDLLDQALQDYLTQNPRAAAEHLHQMRGRTAALVPDQPAREAITDRTSDLIAWMGSMD